jgi:1,6-anhydro-N-acetylmuramate kinase
MRLVLLSHVMRDLAALRGEIAQAVPTAAQRRGWGRDYHALMRELAELRQWARYQRIGLRPQHAEDPGTAWLRRQLDALEGK